MQALFVQYLIMRASKLIVATLAILSFCQSGAFGSGQTLIKPEAVPVYQPKHYPFEAGEKELYSASWNGIFSVATAEISMTSTVIDGQKVYHVQVQAKTSRILDFIWKMRDTITSTFDAKALSPGHFTFSQRENAKVIDTEARLDPATKRWAVSRQQVGQEPQVYEFESENTLDPITAVYLARSMEFKVGDRLYFKIFGGRYRYLLELLVETKEPIELASGKKVEAYRIIPRLQNLTKNGYAERFNEATIWMSADQRRLPVKLSSKIVFGSVYLELVQSKRATKSTAAEPSQPAS
ncbi:MAG: DUF3108 domain-containing protein [Candidatus Binatia bacterium]